MKKMNEDLRQHIGEVYGAEAWEPVTGPLWTDGTLWRLWKFEQDVEHDGKNWRCVILRRDVMAEGDPDAVDYSEDYLAVAWEI